MTFSSQSVSVSRMEWSIWLHFASSLLDTELGMRLWVKLLPCAHLATRRECHLSGTPGGCLRAYHKCVWSWHAFYSIIDLGDLERPRPIKHQRFSCYNYFHEDFDKEQYYFLPSPPGVAHLWWFKAAHSSGTPLVQNTEASGPLLTHTHAF